MGIIDLLFKEKSQSNLLCENIFDVFPDRIYFISFFENSTCYFFPMMLSYNTVKELTRISHRGVAQLG